ncbi:S9 family peptidase [Cellvibrio sp. PSBB006]|uniref:alpha/beta hydrolase family protein n=1 Tax=Cellvibrio sp. PSBB006 TaxID=1987723 RepID=UPI0012F93BA8|nr:alpha/beta fold hydrolase [Cellvibrio sp. PSBB006]
MLGRFCLAVVLLFANATNAETPTKIAKEKRDPAAILAEDFFTPINERNFRLSPDGKYLAFFNETTNAYTLTITDLEKLEVIHNFAISYKSPSNLTWISNRRLIFGVNGAINSVNLDGTDLRVLISHLYEPENINSYRSLVNNFRYWSLMDSLADNPDEILVSSYDKNGYANIHRINVFTGDKEDLYVARELKAGRLYTDRNGNVLLAEKVKKEVREFYKLTTSKNDKPMLASIDIANQVYDLSYDAKSYLARQVIVNGFGYEKDVIYLSENVTGDRFRLVKYNYVTNQHDVIANDEIYDVGTVNEHVDLMFFHKEKKLVGISYQADKPKTIWFDERFKEYQRRLDAQYVGRINEIFDWSENADRLLVYSWSARSRGKIIIFEPESNRFILQSHFSTDLDQYALADKEIYTYPAQDGTVIRSYLTLPEKDKKGKLPLIVLPHGGPFVRSEYTYDGFVQYFSSRGFAVIEPNYRGSVGLGKTHLVSGKHEIANLMLSDMADGARALIAQGTIDPGQVYILGFSYGGYAAIMSALKYPDLYSAAVSYSAPLDLVAQLKYHKKEDHWFAYEFWSDVIGLKTKGKDHIKSLSPLHRMEEIKVPLLVFHGELDTIIPKDQPEAFKKMVEKKKLTIPVTILKSEGHGLGLVSSKVYFSEKAIEHFKRHKKNDL